MINVLIDKIEKYLKTDMRYLIRGGFWLVLEKIGAITISLATMIAFSRWVPKEIFGTYEYILSIIGILGIFTLPGMHNSLTRTVAQHKEGMLRATIKTQAKWSLIGILGSISISIWYFIHQNFILGSSFLIASFLFPIPRISNIAFNFWEGRKNFKVHSKYFIIINFLEALLFIPVLFLTNNLVLVMLSYFLSRALFRLLFLKKTLKETKNNEKDTTTIPLGKHLTLMQGIGLIVANLDKIIIWQFLGPIQVAIYSFAQNVAAKLGDLTSILPLILPKLSQKNIKEIKKELIEKFFKSFLFFIPFTLIIIFSIPFGFKLIFPQYLESIFYTQGLCLSLLLVPFSIISATFTVNNQIKELYLIKTFGKILRIILFAVLIPIYGIWGIIIAILLSEFLNGLFTFYLFKKTNQ